ncbi:stem cell self-renewal protein Piwi, partial [Westerdykella ornata]
YATIKRIADLEYGRHVLCMQMYKLNKQQGTGRKQYFSNVVMKLNIKAGGINYALNFDNLAYKHKTIIMGADVTHPGVGQCAGFPSIACVVGSVDDMFMNYPGSMRLQAGRQEEITDLGSMVTERLKAWQKKQGGRVPEHIIFYRDGISESQFEACLRKEIPAIRNAHREFATNVPGRNNLKLTFIVVGKRHNTRFYALDTADVTSINYEEEGKSNLNVRAGLYVDDFITDPIVKKSEGGTTEFDFYLQSHQAIKGTARSAHYHVLTNDIGLSKASLADLTHKLCYAFSRATKGVSYAAPAYIADRLCERGRVYL